MFSVSLIQVYNEKSLKSFDLRLSVFTLGSGSGTRTYEL